MARTFNPDRLAVLKDPEREKMLDPEVLWRGFGAEHPLSVIDLGAGTGFFAVRFIPWLGRGGTIWACDTDPGMVAWMREHLSAAQLAKVAPLEIEENAVGLPDACADLVYLVNVYHELDDAPRMLWELLRLLKPGAPLAVVDWKKESMRHGPPVAHRVEGAVIRAQMERAGLCGVAEPFALPFHVFFTGRKEPVPSGYRGARVTFPGPGGVQKRGDR
jgi:ubiquinone/menaquinone biosynthesis C-methylase UbiE